MTGILAAARNKIVERFDNSLGTSSTIVHLIVLDAAQRRYILVPQIDTEREEWHNDETVEVSGQVVWLFRRVEFHYHRPFTRREARRHRQDHERRMAAIRAQCDAHVAAQGEHR